MKKTIVALSALALVGSAFADIYIAPYVGYGIGGNGSGGGIVDATPGLQIVLQLIDGGGDGLSYEAGNQVYVNGTASGNDNVIGLAFGTVSSDPGADFSDYGLTIGGTIGGNGTPWSNDLWVRVSGLNAGDWVWEGAISAADADYSDAKTLPEQIDVDGSVFVSSTGTVTVIPEPATIGLMGIAGLGMFLARRKARR